MVKTILIFHSNQQPIAELQTALVGRHQFYATTRRETAIEFLECNTVDCMLFYLPGTLDHKLKRESVRLLKYLRNSPDSPLTKIVICSSHENWPVKDWMELGVTAILGDVAALGRMLV